MREIKFRGQLLNGEWVYGLVCKPTAGKSAGKIFISNSVGIPMAYEVRPETVGQYTGLKDKNDKEIYEGDILGWSDKRKKYVEIVKYQGAYCEEYGNWMGFNIKNNLEVIGNIYENPELLQGDE